MSTPPPFGDPSAVQRENTSAVGRGVMMGCGGCLALLAVPAVLVTILFVGIFASLRMSQPCEDALRAARASSELKKAIGEPMSLGWQVSGSMNIDSGKGGAELRMTVGGPRGTAEIEVRGSLADGIWSYQTLTARPSEGGRVIQLQPPSGRP